MTVELFNELVFDYGANGTDSEQVKSLTDEQREVVSMAWYRSDMDDEVINSYYKDFLKVSDIFISEKDYNARDMERYYSDNQYNLITDNYADYKFHEVFNGYEIYGLSENAHQFYVTTDNEELFFADHTIEAVKEFLK